MSQLSVLFLCLFLNATLVGTNSVPVADCSQFQQALSVNGVFFSFTSLLDNDVGPNGYLRVRLVYEGLNWLGFGTSQSGHMVPGFAVIGVPAVASGLSNPGKYQLNGYGIEYVNLLNQSRQTLQNASILQNATHTTLSFTKRMHEIGEYEIHGNGSNTFIYAVGVANSLAQHSFSGNLLVRLRACINGAPIVITPAPSEYPTPAPSPSADLNMPFTLPPTDAPTRLPPGASASPTNALTSNPTLAIFNVTTFRPSSLSPSFVPSHTSPSRITSVPRSVSPSVVPSWSGPSHIPAKAPTAAKPATSNSSSSSPSRTLSVRQLLPAAATSIALGWRFM